MTDQTQSNIEHMVDNLDYLRRQMQTVAGMDRVQGAQTKEQRLATLEHLAGSAIQTLVAACDVITEMGGAIDALKEAYENVNEDMESRFGNGPFGDPTPPDPLDTFLTGEEEGKAND